MESMRSNDYKSVVPGMGYYLKNRNIVAIFKEKYALLGAISRYKERINLLSNSLEQMGYFRGHKDNIRCLSPLSSNILSSGSVDMTIKIWDIEHRSIISTLYNGHTDTVSFLCYVRECVFVSGSHDKSLIIWNKSSESPTYSSGHVLRGHTSYIKGIIRISNREIVSGEDLGDLRLWNIDQGLCIRQIPNMGENSLFGMKQHIGGDVVVSYWRKVIVWGAQNNWAEPVHELDVSAGYSIELLSEDILLRGGMWGQLEFIHYMQTDAQLPLPIDLHSGIIYELLRIAKDIVIISAADNTLKVINPRSKECYLIFEKGAWDEYSSMAYFY